ncbi:hypothetical protein R3P38DRAFT_2785699 [Favolaschia claudopus]|uniref:Uncharacterized protein n=1 Tax=Favolaschia claudopus TaxID=2862362 RepID=A0AAW0ASN2_9AGAR
MINCAHPPPRSGSYDLVCVISLHPIAPDHDEGWTRSVLTKRFSPPRVQRKYAEWSRGFVTLAHVLRGQLPKVRRARTSKLDLILYVTSVLLFGPLGTKSGLDISSMVLAKFPISTIPREGHRVPLWPSIHKYVQRIAIQGLELKLERNGAVSCLRHSRLPVELNQILVQISVDRLSNCSTSADPFNRTHIPAGVVRSARAVWRQTAASEIACVHVAACPEWNCGEKRVGWVDTW